LLKEAGGSSGGRRGRGGHVVLEEALFVFGRTSTRTDKAGMEVKRWVGDPQMRERGRGNVFQTQTPVSTGRAGKKARRRVGKKR